MNNEKKPVSVYLFAILIIFLYIMYILTNIYILTSSDYIINNPYNFYILIPIMFIGLISSFFLLIAKKYKIVTSSFSIIILTIAVMMFMNMVGKFNKLELGVNIIPFLIIFIVFGFIKSFRKYFAEYFKKEGKNSEQRK